MVIDITTFRLTRGVTRDEFLEADRRVQTEVVPNRDGFVRRTTAHGDGGEWAVVTLWGSKADADASAALAAGHPAVAAFDATVDPASVRTSRYTTLD